jgi:hypothetical protein
MFENERLVYEAITNIMFFAFLPLVQYKITPVCRIGEYWH